MVVVNDLRAALERVRRMPDPPQAILLRNARHKSGKRYRAHAAERLVLIAKLCECLSTGERGPAFHLGSLELGTVLLVRHHSCLEALADLERFGLIRREWVGGLCLRGPDGVSYVESAKPVLVRRASEYHWNGWSNFVMQSSL